MQIIHLLVEDDYIQSFVDGLEKDKVSIVEKEFDDNKKNLQETLDIYNENRSEFKLYYESMKNVSNWLTSKEV